MGKGRFSIIMLLGSIVAGVLYGFLGEVIFRALEYKTTGVVIVAVYFLGMFLFIGTAVFLLGRMIHSRMYSKINGKQWILTFVGIMLLSVLFEFLYEIDFSNPSFANAESYIFVIDNSDSMEDGDPNGLRYEAINKLIDDKDNDFKYAVYTFSDGAVKVRDMIEKGEGAHWEPGYNNGGAAIYGTLETIINDIKSGDLEVGNNCRMIFLSDGYASDIGFLSSYKVIGLLKQYVEENISISTIGLQEADYNLMSLIADKTGGVYIDVNDVTALDSTMEWASVSQDLERNLLGYRYKTNYAIIRIMFITILGLVIAVQKAVLCEKFPDTATVFYSSGIGAMLAGVGMEFGINVFGINPIVMRMALCVLIAFTLLKEDLPVMHEAGRSINSSEDSY